MDKKPTAADVRRLRLAKALKANLARRKAKEKIQKAATKPVRD